MEPANICDVDTKKIEEAERKYLLLEPLLSKGYFLSKKTKQEYIQEVCIKLNKSERTIRRYIQKARDIGIIPLIKKKRCDAGKFRAISSKLLTKALYLLEENSTRSVPMLINILKADDEFKEDAKKIKVSTLYYNLKKTGYDFGLKNKEQAGKIYHKFEADYPNQLWQGDARHGISLPHPDKKNKTKVTHLFAWVDDFSRKIVYANYYWDEKLPRLEDSFRQAVLRWGLPKKCYCDNGAVYISHNFTFIVNSLGIRKIHHPPYAAYCKGKVESIMKRIKQFQNEAKMAGFKTIEELNVSLHAWLNIEHDNRIHSSTGETPNNRFRNNLKVHSIKRITNLDSFNALFLYREERTINKYGQIRFNNNFYKVHDLIVGCIVEIRYDPFDTEEIQLFHHGKFIRILKAYKLTKKSINNMPEETKNKSKVSKESRAYFSKIREKHLKNQKEQANKIQFSDIQKQEEYHEE